MIVISILILIIITLIITITKNILICPCNKKVFGKSQKLFKKNRPILNKIRTPSTYRFQTNLSLNIL